MIPEVNRKLACHFGWQKLLQTDMQDKELNKRDFPRKGIIDA